MLVLILPVYPLSKIRWIKKKKKQRPSHQWLREQFFCVVNSSFSLSGQRGCSRGKEKKCKAVICFCLS